MKPESPTAHPARGKPPRRLPAFYPVPLRDRHNGWSAERQARFVGLLAETGSVAAACAGVGMSRNSAYKLRRRPDAESFAAAWDAALGLPFARVTVRDLHYLAFEGLIRPVMYRGRCVGIRRKPDNSALLRLMDRLDRAALRQEGKAAR